MNRLSPLGGILLIIVLGLFLYINVSASTQHNQIKQNEQSKITEDKQLINHIKSAGYKVQNATIVSKRREAHAVLGDKYFITAKLSDSTSAEYSVYPRQIKNNIQGDVFGIESTMDSSANPNQYDDVLVHNIDGANGLEMFNHFQTGKTYEIVIDKDQEIVAEINPSIANKK